MRYPSEVRTALGLRKIPAGVAFSCQWPSAGPPARPRPLVNGPARRGRRRPGSSASRSSSSASVGPRPPRPPRPPAPPPAALGFKLLHRKIDIEAGFASGCGIGFAAGTGFAAEVRFAAETGFAAAGQFRSRRPDAREAGVAVSGRTLGPRPCNPQKRPPKEIHDASTVLPERSPPPLTSAGTAIAASGDMSLSAVSRRPRRQGASHIRRGSSVREVGCALTAHQGTCPRARARALVALATEFARACDLATPAPAAPRRRRHGAPERWTGGGCASPLGCHADRRLRRARRRRRRGRMLRGRAAPSFEAWGFAQSSLPPPPPPPPRQTCLPLAIRGSAFLFQCAGNEMTANAADGPAAGDRGQPVRGGAAGHDGPAPLGCARESSSRIAANCEGPHEPP